MIDKQTALAALEAYRGKCNGTIASTVAECIKLVEDIPETHISDFEIPAGAQVHTLTADELPGPLVGEGVFHGLPEHNGWIPVTERLPEVEERVLLMAASDDGKGGTFHDVMCGFYEDGNMWREDSKCNWDYEMMQSNLYDEDRDDYRVPEGWYEELTNRIEDYNVVAIPDLVTHWMPLPEGPREEK